MSITAQMVRVLYQLAESGDGNAGRRGETR